MANETTSATLVSIINAEAILESRLAFQRNANLVQYIRVADITGQPTKAASFPIWTAVAVSKTAEGTDQTTNAAGTATDVVLTVARRIVKINAMDLAVGAANENVSQKLGQVIGLARAKQVDTDILGVMTTNYTSSVGATNSTDVSVANIMSALLTLEGNEANDNLILALHQKQWNHLRGDLVLTSMTSTGSDTRLTDRSEQGRATLSNGQLSIPLFGAQVIVTPRVGTGTDTNDMFLGALFNAEALGYAVKNASAEVGVPDIELQRDASLGSTEYVMNYYDSAGIIRTAGVVLIKSQTY